MNLERKADRARTCRAELQRLAQLVRCENGDPPDCSNCCPFGGRGRCHDGTSRSSLFEVPWSDLPTEDIWQKVSWRAHLYARKAKGDIPELSWSELWQMTRRAGFGLESFSRRGVSVDGSVQNPFVTDDDYHTGGRIFREKCAECHGSAGKGSHGPPLNRPGLKSGDSDLAIYKVLRDGVPGTSMVSAALSVQERWQVVGYIRTLHRSFERVANHITPLDIRVSNEQILESGRDTDQWLTYSGSLGGHRHTPLNEVTPANVAQLRVRWVRQFNTSDSTIESTPLVVNGIIFTTEPPASVVALDARTGEVIWRYHTGRTDAVGDPPRSCCRRKVTQRASGVN